jgi:ribosomal protein S19
MRSDVKESRATTIQREHLEKTYRVHTGRTWVKIRPTQEMRSLKFGELVKTRMSRPYVKKAGGRVKKSS